MFAMESHHITDRKCKTSTYPDLFNTAAPKSPGRSKQRNVGMSNVPGETEKETRGEEMLLAKVTSNMVTFLPSHGANSPRFLHCSVMATMRNAAKTWKDWVNDAGDTGSVSQMNQRQ